MASMGGKARWDGKSKEARSRHGKAMAAAKKAKLAKVAGAKVRKG